MVILVLAAALEAGGDALMRTGMHAPSAGRRVGFMLAGGLVLALYGYLVNTPPWDFGRLLGVYVVLFFLVIQVINWLAYGQKPTPSLILGGILIAAGGLVVSLSP